MGEPTSRRVTRSEIHRMYSRPAQCSPLRRCIFSAVAPGCGWARYDLRAGDGESSNGNLALVGLSLEDDEERARIEQVEDGSWVLTNGIVTVTVDTDGLITAVHDEIHDRA